MTSRFTRLPLAVAAAAALALGTLAPTPARADADLQRFLAGAAGLALLYGILDANRRAHAAPPARQWQPDQRQGRGYQPPQRQRLVLPAQCAVQVAGRGRGQPRQVLYTERCLERAGINTRRLPQQCRVTLRTDRGVRAVFDGTCLDGRVTGDRNHRNRLR